MTTIVYKDGVMVGDRQCTWDKKIPTQLTKVFRVRKGPRVYLLGFAGNPSQGLRYVEHFKKNKLWTKLDDFKGADVLVAWEDKLWMVEEENDVTEISLGYWTLGTGGDFALAALKMGATAEEAVQLAISLDINSGQGTDVIRF